MRRSVLRRGYLLAAFAAATALAVPGTAMAATPAGHSPGGGAPPTGVTPSGATAVGFGGAVATVDPTATSVGLEVLRRGGNAVDAAVAAAATLGVTEPFSSGIGGGGFFVYYDARTRSVHTLDGRETAPVSMDQNAFVNSSTGQPYAFQEGRVSGISAGIPGSLLTWQTALHNWGSGSLRDALAPAIGVAQHGFPVDATFAGQISSNAAAFSQFTSTRALYLPNGAPPAVGSTFRNPDLANTYRLIARDGVRAFYRGPIAGDIVHTVQHPPLAADPAMPWAYQIRPGTMRTSDLAAYTVRQPAPTHVTYHGLDVYGMATPSSGGSTTGEALDILKNFDLAHESRTTAMNDYLEASALAFADRNRFVGDYTPRSELNALLTNDFGKQRACQVNQAHALAAPVGPGVPGGSAGCTASAGTADDSNEQSTTNLTVADRWGNVVEYTLTIEQIGGNAMLVPGRGFLLNNELTDFNFTPTQGSAPDPNLPGPGKRPRSSMSPTILLDHGRPFLAVGSPGGATIITTVLQILVNRLDFGMSLPDAIAAPRASQRNSATTDVEQPFLDSPQAGALAALGYKWGTPAEIGAATGIEFLSGNRLLAAAEPVRRGSGSAGVVHPTR
ncbi:gamma-glutamyltranspeptidase [Rugosimonospora africana]|uniref:Glutathione hydrolase proenzyme n=2 Tax=Rugosimonospora africana TaxID=556532 RepID=A0A8J3QUN9_9ACTN|nr:gamma-glutamyltranspeptidase [Rugosimonospora africana]